MNKIALAIKATQFLSAAGIIRGLSPIYGGIGSILMLHRMTHDPNSELNHAMFTTTVFLDHFIQFLKSNQIDMVSLDEMIYRVSHPEKRSQQFVCFTFDDGYRDNLTLALPIFEKHQVPFAVYISSGLIERRFPYWGRVIEQIFQDHVRLTLQYHGKTFEYPENATYDQKKKNLSAFMRVLHFDREHAKERVKGIYEQFGVDEYQLLDQEALTQDQVRVLAKSNLVTIGAHTVNHVNLRSLEESAVYDEMMDSKHYLEHLIDQPVCHFAYPFGDDIAVSRREFDLAQKAGFISSTTTKLGTLKHQHQHHLQALPRLPFNIKFESLELMEFFRSGIPAQIQQKTLIPTL